ncbi:hypothetical protein AVEN_68897-1 [Araneus ventricosus]|uniref:Endonuclease/exonuclease/phosphatase domain-containing protein n=1 Tax=Araneus ventricosus TaxID=182803 RepID=A0A4Y2C5I7_ARAVE|nr:hypothetical protein AVEN_68897-1 [Araneus ventricosus]
MMKMHLLTKSSNANSLLDVLVFKCTQMTEKFPLNAEATLQQNEENEQNITFPQVQDNVRSFNIITGDFNCHFQTWGYNFEDHRGRKLMEFLTLNNLNICNIKKHGSTFISRCLNTVYPELTIVSSALIDKVKQWGILDRYSFSAHRYIYFKLDLEFQHSTEFYLKTGYGSGKFLRGLMPHIESLTLHLNSVHCLEDIDSFFVEFIDIASELAMEIFKKSRIGEGVASNFGMTVLGHLETLQISYTKFLKERNNLIPLRLRSMPRGLNIINRGPFIRNNF